MTDRPIIFSAPMVRALLDGRKTQTRRLAWRYPADPENGEFQGQASSWQHVRPGDRLWVREAFAAGRAGNEVVALYRATDEQIAEMLTGVRWRPSIHMPRWASRITLTVTNVRRQRLQDISATDATAEGVPEHEGMRWAFHMIWDGLHGDGAWDAIDQQRSAA